MNIAEEFFLTKAKKLTLSEKIEMCVGLISDAMADQNTIAIARINEDLRGHLQLAKMHAQQALASHINSNKGK